MRIYSLMDPALANNWIVKAGIKILMILVVLLMIKWIFMIIDAIRRFVIWITQFSFFDIMNYQVFGSGPRVIHWLMFAGFGLIMWLEYRNRDRN